MKLQKVLIEDQKQKKAMKSTCDCECVTTVITSCSSFENQEIMSKNKVDEKNETEEDRICSSKSGCCTPKAKRYRIPEVLTCPPAPKKRRVTPSPACSSINKSPIALFASPDIDLFFFSALKNVSV